ncbi:hypothetical protein EON67_03835 [archaeon]|nr:MAG: hypothetical protein EON67_03835 [archaeon]
MYCYRSILPWCNVLCVVTCGVCAHVACEGVCGVAGRLHWRSVSSPVGGLSCTVVAVSRTEPPPLRMTIQPYNSRITQSARLRTPGLIVSNLTDPGVRACVCVCVWVVV